MPTIEDIRSQYPELAGLDDDQAVGAIHQAFYADLPREQVAASFGVKPRPAPAPPPPPPSGIMRRAGDVALSLGKSAIAWPETLVGMADLVSGGRAGKAVEDAGVRFKDAKAVLDEYMSPEAKAAKEKFQQSEGVVDAIGTAVTNPSLIVNAAAESAFPMLAGGLIGRGLMSAAPAIGRVGAAAAGEGITAAGSGAEQIRQQTADGLLTGTQSAVAAGSGALTGALGVLGGKVAQRLGITDVDTLIAGGANSAAAKGFTRRVLEGAVSEGLLEELPQSIQEQVAQNYALGKPLDEGVAQAAVLGALTGGAMGGAVNVMAGQRPTPTPGDIIRQDLQPETGPMTRAVNAATNLNADLADAGQDPLATVAPEEAAAAELQAQKLAEPVGPETSQALPAEQASIPPSAPTEQVDLLPPVSAAIAQREADRPPQPTEQVQPEDVLNALGRPFTTMPGAMRAMKGREDTHDIVRVVGGLVLRPKAAQQVVEQPAAPVEPAMPEAPALQPAAMEQPGTIPEVPDAPVTEPRADAPTQPAAPTAEAPPPAAVAATPEAGVPGTGAAPALETPGVAPQTQPEDANVSPQPDLPAPAGMAAGAPDGPTPDSGRGQPDVGPGTDLASGPVSSGSSPAPVVSGGAPAVAGGGGQPDTALTPASDPADWWAGASAKDRIDTLIRAGWTATDGKPSPSAVTVAGKAWADLRPVQRTRIAAAVGAERPANAAQAEASPPAAPEARPMPAIGSIPFKAAEDAHRGTSHSPEVRAKQEQDGFAATLRQAWGQAAKAAGDDPAALARVTELFTEVAEGYRSRYMAALGARSRVMSSMIVGPARFPVERNRKRLETERRRSEEASQYLERGIKRLLRAARGPIDNSPESELERVRQNLSEREERQEFMKAANAALRKGDDEALRDLGMSDAEIAEFKKPDYAGRPGFPAYELTNNNAEIRRLRERLTSAEQRVAAAQAGPVERERPGVKIVEDATDDRLRLLFDDKPGEAVREDLKTNGFKWSPKNSAWQRQLTGNARAAAKRVLDKHYPASSASDAASASLPAERADPAQDQGEEPAFSRAGQADPDEQHRARIEAAAEAIRKAWENGPQVVVAQNMRDTRIPEAVRREDEKQRSNGASGEPEGFFYRGTAYLLADQLANPREAARVLFHEALGHYGLRGTFGTALGPILDRMATMQAAKVRAKAKQYGLDFDDKKQRRVAAEEVLAEMAQSTPKIGWVRQAVAAIRSWLRENVPGFKNMRLTDDEVIRSYILPARGFVERGREAERARDAVPAFQRGTNATVANSKDVAGNNSGSPAGDTKPGTQSARFSEDNRLSNLSWRGASWTRIREQNSALAKLASPDDEVTIYRATIGDTIRPDDFVAVDKRVAAMELENVRARDGVGEIVSMKVRARDLLMGNDATEFVYFPENESPAPNRDGAPMFSRSATLGDARSIDQQAIRNRVADLLGNAGAKVSWWDRTLGTQYAKAQKNPEYRRVFDAVQGYLEDVSSLANRAANEAPAILPKLDNWKDLKRSATEGLGLSPKDTEALAGPVFEGTLGYVRSPDGRLLSLDDAEAAGQELDPQAKAQAMLKAGTLSSQVLRMWQGLPADQFEAAVETRYRSEMLSPGVVWTDAELRSRFKLSEAQIGHYRQFRAAVDHSLDQVVAADVLRLLGDVPVGFKALAVHAPRQMRAAVEEYLQQSKPDDSDLWNDIADRFNRIDQLKARGYAPLMRFGKFKVHAVDPAGETQFFGLYETRSEANRMARELRADPDLADAKVTQGVLSQEAYKLFSEVPPESLEMFAQALGAEKTAIFQEYIRLAKNNRSALKRLIKRKGTAGFSEDAPRVLASFVTSNARLGAAAMNLPGASRAAEEITDGDVQDEAVKLVEAVRAPQEQAAAVRGLMFMNFIGGSIASAVVNLTQPITMTLPYLSQFGGLPAATKRLMAASALVAKGVGQDRQLGAALARAEADGIVSPQEIHHLQAQAMSTWGTNPFVRRAAFIWSAPFSLAEQWNRRVSFIAAYNTARETGESDPFGFAEKAVVETQGLYNRGNAPNWARNPAGALALQFKQYSIHYLEWMSRMWKSGPDGKKAVGIALLLLAAAGGADGLPFAEDIDDLVDTIGQALGYDSNFKRSRREFIAKDLGMGDMAAEVFTRGLSSLPGVPMDVSLRMGMGNLLPATGVLLRSNTDRSRDVLEVAGAAGGLAKQYTDAATKGLEGDFKGAVIGALPVALQNLAKAIGMWSTGEARDDKGRKVMEADAVDGMMRALGFNPAEIARESQRMGMIRRSEQLAKNVEGKIVEKWARGVADKDQEAIKEARAELLDWNRTNPQQPIRVTPTQIRQRASKMMQSRSERFLKSVSPERRTAAAEVLP